MSNYSLSLRHSLRQVFIYTVLSPSTDPVGKKPLVGSLSEDEVLEIKAASLLEYGEIVLADQQPVP